MVSKYKFTMQAKWQKDENVAIEKKCMKRDSMDDTAEKASPPLFFFQKYHVQYGNLSAWANGPGLQVTDPMRRKLWESGCM